ncbi:hypothetical protein [Azospirillum rugosum]|uniref:Uncharacterized protein n=1 Tax=Azospirillum rugosum TaxID=416170 RepID=A0ABS4SDZ0_9PROT|nr:hypothetical protein [Azospirillum rugosum]MBP2290712.1 hypothetical protein [Azospirillum rugosum]MDQ0525601.1 hypothetical protein [Azospirillum rugosum]
MTFVRPRPQVGVLYQSLRAPFDMVVKRVGTKNLQEKAVLVKKGDYLVVSSNGDILGIIPAVYASRFETVPQHFDCQGRQRPAEPTLTPEEIAALFGDDG